MVGLPESSATRTEYLAIQKSNRDGISEMKNVIVITGTSSGFGALMAQDRVPLRILLILNSLRIFLLNLRKQATIVSLAYAQYGVRSSGQSVRAEAFHHIAMVIICRLRRKRKCYAFL